MESSTSAQGLDALRKGVADAEAEVAEVDESSSEALHSLSSIQFEPLAQQPWTPQLVYTLGGGILLFGIVMSLAMGYLIKEGKPTDQVLRAFCVPLIVVAAVFLVVVGYNQEQIAPVIGLLGTIAGYLLGRDGRGESAAPTATAKVSSK